jgi:hypothetical protein
MHPAAHLAASLTTLKEAKEALAAARKSDMRSAMKQAVLHALAAGHALACMLHPAAAQLPASLLRSALQNLSDGLASLGEFKPVAASPDVAGSIWAQRAKSTPAFKELFDMIGLHPVKKVSGGGTAKLRLCAALTPVCLLHAGSV